MRVLTLLTDFGVTDYYVGAVKGTVLRLAPGVDHLVDLAHDLAAGDVEGAADLLAAAAPTFPAGAVHLAVVDPGVGSDRRILAVRAGEHRFVAPDNGLLTPFLATAPTAPSRTEAGPAVGLESGAGRPEIRSVVREELFLDAPGSTFHGRDRFAPVAAAVLRGEPLESLGPVIEDPVLLDRPAPTRKRRPDAEGGGTVLCGRVVRIDRFGNLVTDLPAEWLGRPEALHQSAGPDRRSGDDAARVEVGVHATERWIAHYAELPEGEPGALVGSLGTVELSLRGRSLAARWGIERGAAVRITLPSSPAG